MASPLEAASAQGRSSLTSPLASSPIRCSGDPFAGHRQGSGQTTSSALTVPSKRNEVWHRIDGKNCFLLL
jgi:hypothetical protein